MEAAATPTPQSAEGVDGVHKTFEEAARRYSHFVVAYSGGKDSTAVAILLYKWIEQARPNIRVTLLFNDTLSEIGALEAWVRQFTQAYVERAGRYVEASARFVVPRADETFFWTLFVRGYPAPTFKFRWCTDQLKIRPASAAVRELGEGAVVVTGQRDEESAARAASMKKRFGACAPGTCAGVYFSQSDGVPKLAPIRFWTTQDVWRFLLRQRDFDVSPLVALYGLDPKTLTAPGGRFGCWHCTLVKTATFAFLGREYAYIEALRLLYRAVSDVRELRVPKQAQGGYSALGPLTPEARSLMYHLVPLVEERSGHRFYGLDVAEVEGRSLRELFYQMDPAAADAVVRRLDKTGRWIGMERLRALDRGVLRRHADALLARVRELDRTATAARAAEELLGELL
jgi:DNA sulfur modification protein DndC